MGSDKFFLFLICLLLISCVSGQLNTGYEDNNDLTIQLTKPIPPTNTTTGSQTFNKSDIWVTDEGNLDNIPDLYPTLDLRFLELDGSNFGFSTGAYLSYSNPNFIFNEIKLNATVMDLTKTIFYNATAVEIEVGTLVAGDLLAIQSYNNVPYSIDEDASDLELRVNFTIGIENDFNNLIVRYRNTEEDLAHTMVVEIYEPDNADWEEYGTLPGTSVYSILQFGVFDSDEHIDSFGVVQVRFLQDEGVPPKTHQHDFDWVTISKGFGTPNGEESDPLSLHSDGSVLPSGNFNWNNFNITNISRLGIGTNNPIERLHLVEDSDQVFFIMEGDGGSIFEFVDSTANADQKRYQFRSDDGEFRIDLLNDARTAFIKKGIIDIDPTGKVNMGWNLAVTGDITGNKSFFKDWTNLTTADNLWTGPNNYSNNVTYSGNYTIDYSGIKKTDFQNMIIYRKDIQGLGTLLGTGDVFPGVLWRDVGGAGYINVLMGLAGNTLQTFSVGGDPYPRRQDFADGKIKLGDGTSATDVSFSRLKAGWLQVTNLYSPGELNGSIIRATNNFYAEEGNLLTSRRGYSFSGQGGDMRFYANGSSMYYVQGGPPSRIFGHNTTIGAFEVFIKSKLRGDIEVLGDGIFKSQMALGDQGVISGDRIFDLDGGSTGFGGVFTPSASATGGEYSAFAFRPDVDAGVTRSNLNAMRILNPSVSGTMTGVYRGILSDTFSAGTEQYLIWSQNHIAIDQDNEAIILGEGQEFKISLDSASNGNYTLAGAGVHTFYNSSGLGTVRAARYITGSLAPDTENVNYLEKFSNIDNWVNNDGSLNYQSHPSYVQVPVIDESNCWDVILEPEYCYDGGLICEDKPNQELQLLYGDERVIEDKTKECEIKLADGYDLEKRTVDVEGGVGQLIEKINILETELCKKDNTYAFCSGVEPQL